MAGLRGRLPPPLMACVAAADARAHAFDELCPVHGLRQSALIISGALIRCRVCARPALRLFRVQRAPSKWLAQRSRRGAAVQLRGGRAPPIERVAPSRADDAVTAERNIAERTSLSITTRNVAIRLDGARYNKLHTPLLCGHRHSPPAKRSH